MQSNVSLKTEVREPEGFARRQKRRRCRVGRRGLAWVLLLSGSVLLQHQVLLVACNQNSFSSNKKVGKSVRDYFTSPLPSSVERSEDKRVLKRRLANSGGSSTAFTSTKLTGYGSSKKHLDSGPSSESDVATLWVRPVPIPSAEQHTQLGKNSGHQSALKVFSATHNATVQIGPDLHLQSVENESFQAVLQLNETTKWISVEGLYGAYELPSGHVWVWIKKSTPVYHTAPTGGNDTEPWTLRRIDELRLQHVANAQQVLTRSQRQEEYRQLQLLRQALKHHEWYFSQGKILPDITRSLQQSVELAQKHRGNQKQGEDVNHTSTNGKHVPWWQVTDSNTTETFPDSRFFWNQAVLEPLCDRRQDPCSQVLLSHAVPVTSAFCGVQTNLTTTEMNHQTCSYDQILITRRSRLRAGTRFTRRGADQTGNVANYAETEQIVVLRQREIDCDTQTKDGKGNSTASVQRLAALCSHVQTRGSIPLRWSSPTDIKAYRPRVRIGTDPLAQARAVREHLVDQGRRYILLPVRTTPPANQRSNFTANVTTKLSIDRKHAGLVLVNLIDKKSDQGRLGRAMDAVLQAVLDVYTMQPDPEYPWLHRSLIEHVWYDFHALVKHGRWDRLITLLNQVKPALKEQGYFRGVPQEDGTIRTEKLQTGVIRTNCMDCLDRTNVVQSLFGRYVLFHQLKEDHTSSASFLPESFRTAFRQKPMTLPWADGEIAHRLLWADNADAISRLYAGTPALKGDFTRTGQRTKKGALDDGMNSLQRYYLNNFLDADRQEGMDLLTGYQAFSHVRGDDDATVPADVPLWQQSFSRGSSLHEVARQMMRGSRSSGDVLQSESDRNHERIKVQRGRKSKRKRPLDLLWLPGDLQSQVRSLAASLELDGDTTTSVLADIDRRASSDLPWWVIAESSDDDNGSLTRMDAVLLDTETAAGNNAGYLLGALVAGTQAPLTMATLVLGLVGLVSFPRNVD